MGHNKRKIKVYLGMIGFGTLLGLHIDNLPVPFLCVGSCNIFALFLALWVSDEISNFLLIFSTGGGCLGHIHKDRGDVLLFSRCLGCVAAIGSKCLRCRFKLVHFGFFQLMTFKFMGPNDKERHFNKQHDHT
jgi:hypothetical protein